MEMVTDASCAPGGDQDQPSREASERSKVLELCLGSPLTLLKVARQKTVKSPGRVPTTGWLNGRAAERERQAVMGHQMAMLRQGLPCLRYASKGGQRRKVAWIGQQEANSGGHFRRVGAFSEPMPIVDWLHWRCPNIATDNPTHTLDAKHVMGAAQVSRLCIDMS